MFKHSKYFPVHSAQKSSEEDRVSQLDPSKHSSVGLIDLENVYSHRLSQDLLNVTHQVETKTIK